MIVGVTRYSALGLNSAHYRQLVHKLAVDVPELARKLGAEAVVVRGTSGISVAFGMRMVTDFPFIVARKPDESHHSHDQLSLVRDGNSWTVGKYLILDDVICSGDTVNGIIKDLGERECMGVIEYNGLMGNYKLPSWGHSKPSMYDQRTFVNCCDCYRYTRQ